MQLNNPKNNTSNLIKQNEYAKKKARRRLVGSVFMLLSALIILLNVTTKVKPIPVNPKVIEISNNTSAPIKAVASAPEQITTASAPVNASEPLVADNTNASAAVGNGFRAGVVNRGEKTNASATSQAVITAAPFIVTMNLGSKPSPEDILNGNTSGSQETIYYIQIASGQNKAALQSIQTSLANSSIKSFIQNGKNGIFRLRVGPFKNKDDVNNKLTQIKNSLNQ
jgi:cell division septation protein DedD